MHRLPLSILCVCCGLALFQSSCKKQNGTTSKGGPVSNAQKQNGPSVKGPKSNIRNKLKQVADNSKQAYLKPQFVDRAVSLDLQFKPYRDDVPGRFYFPEVMGAGIGWIDFDLDGFWDIYLGNGDQLVGDSTHVNQLFRNLNGTGFANISEFASPDGSGFTQGIAVGDSNQDGFEDILVSNFGQTYLLLNQGDGSFLKTAIASGEDESEWKASCIQVDLDQDGDLDIFVTCYIDWTVANHHPCTYKGVTGYCGPGTYEATRDLLFENNGDGTYTEKGLAAGVDYESKGLVVCAGDFNQDRVPEIYVGSDLTKNAFYVKQPGGFQFKNVADDTGVAASKNGLAEATMGFALRDFDTDGRLDLFLTHYYQNKNTLYLNQGDLLFKDASYESRIKALSFDSIGFGTVPVDYDNDADFDLFVSNGHVLGEGIAPFRLKPQLINNDRGRFYDISDQSGKYFSQEWVGRSVASCDFDNDGDVDIAVGHLDQPMALLVNETVRENRFIQFQLLALDRRDLVGTRVIVKMGDEERVLPVVRGESYLASVDPRLHIGVGSAEKVSVTIEWSNGSDSVFAELATNATWLLDTSGTSHRMD